MEVQLDSVTSMLHKLSYTDTDLRSAKEIQEGRDRNMLDITKDLQDYSRNAENLISAYKYVSEYAFTMSSGVLQLTDATNNYNQAYNTLDSKKAFYQKVIADYWGKPQRTLFKTLFRLRWILFMQARFTL